MDRRWRDHGHELGSVAFYLLLLLLESHLPLRSGQLLLLSAASFFALLIIKDCRPGRLALLLPPALLLGHWLGRFDVLPLALALFFIYLAAGPAQPEGAFLQRLFRRLRACSWAGAFAVAVYCFALLLLWAVQSLFGGLQLLRFSDRLLDFTIALVAPLALLHFYRRSRPSPMDRLCRRLGDLVLLIYCLIIYGYLGQILLKQQLPNGEVVKVLLPYLMGGLYLQGWHRSALDGESSAAFARLSAGFYRWLNWLNLAPLALLLLAIEVRIANYGLTPERIHLLVLAALLVLANGLLLWPAKLRSRLNSYRLILVLMAATALVDGYLLPHQRWSNASQWQRLERLLRDNDLLRDGQMDWEKFREFSRDPAHGETIRQMRAARNYLGPSKDGEEIKPFGIGSGALDERSPAATIDRRLRLPLTGSRPLALPATPQQLLLAGDRHQLEREHILAANPAAIFPTTADWQRHLVEQLAQVGLDQRAPLDRAQQEKLLPALLRLEFHGQIFVANELELLWEENGGWQVQSYRYGAYVFSATP